MEKRFIKIKVTEVHEYIAWVPAPDEETAMEMLRVGEDPDIETATVSRDFVSEVHMGRAGADDCAQTRAMYSYLDSLRQGTSAEAAAPAAVDDDDAAPPTEVDETPTPRTTDEVRVGSLDDQINVKLAQVDAAIARLRKARDKSSEAWMAAALDATRQASALLSQVQGLKGKVFTATGNVISQEGVMAAIRKVCRRIDKLKALGG